MNIAKNKFLKVFIIFSLVFNFSSSQAFLGRLFKKKQPKPPSGAKVLVVTSAILVAYFGCMFAVIGACTGLGYVMDKIVKNREFRNRMKKCLRCKESHTDCICAQYQEIDYACKNHRTFYDMGIEKWRCREIKYLLSKLDNINVVFDTDFIIGDNHTYRLNNCTSLHIACYHGNFPIIKWLIEEKFADIDVVCDSIEGNVSVRYLYEAILSRMSRYRFPENSHNPGLLAQKEHLQQRLFDQVQKLKDLVTANNRIDAKAKFKEIKKFMKSKKTPGCSKQVVMSSLVEVCQQDNKVISKNDLSNLYKNIAFNYNFLHQDRFKIARNYANINNIKDIYGKTILQAYATCGQSDELLTEVMVKKPEICDSENLTRFWLSQKSNKGFLNKAFQSCGGLVGRAKNFVLRKKEQQIKQKDKIKKDFNKALDQATQENRAKIANTAWVLSDLADYDLVKTSCKKRVRDIKDQLKSKEVSSVEKERLNIDLKEYEKKIKERYERKANRVQVKLCKEVASLILEYRGNDFGNKIYY